MAENHSTTNEPTAEKPPVSGGMKNEYFIRDGYVVIIIPTGDGSVECLVDLEDFGIVSSIRGFWAGKWSKGMQTYYAWASSWEKRLNYGHILMHRLILNAPRDIQVDHINQSCTLDNRRQNIRLATPRQNSLNRRNWSVINAGEYWRADMTFRGERYNLGIYSTEPEARAIMAGARILADCIEARESGTTSLALHRERHHLDTGLPPVDLEPPPITRNPPRKYRRSFKSCVLLWLHQAGYSRCFVCGEVKCLSEFSPASLRLCRPCNTKRCNAYYHQNEVNRRKMLRAAAEWRKANPQKQRLVAQRSYLNRKLKAAKPELFGGTNG
jgi:hypothetical protein